MSPPQDRGAVHSLPSFAQAFNSLPPDDRALPPIHGHHSSISPHRNLPPASRRHPPSSRAQAITPSNSQVSGSISKKRPRSVRDEDADDDNESSDSHSPTQTVKQEQDLENLDQLEPTPPSTPRPVKQLSQPLPLSQSNSKDSYDSSPVDSSAPLPSLLRPNPPSKRRRVTISGGSQTLNSLNTSNLPTSTAGSTPISPVVVGFTIQRDDPAAIEQVRAMLSVKQKQKAIIESRRGSLVGGALPPGRESSTAAQPVQAQENKKDNANATVVPSVNILNPTPTSAVPPSPRNKASPSPGVQRLAPSPSQQMVPPSNVGTPSSSPKNRLVNGLKASNSTGNVSGGNARPHSPSMPIISSQGSRAAAGPQDNRSSPSQAFRHSPNNSIQATHIASQGLTALANALPPPPTSFTRRREAQMGVRVNKPADIVIRPREGVRLSGVGASKTGIPSTGGQHIQQQQHQEHHVAAASAALAHYKSLQPSIQSAPAVARPGQAPGRFPSMAMAIPSIPPIINQRNATMLTRRAAGQVPPTPTRLTMQRSQGSSAESASVRLSQPTGAPPSSTLTSHATLPVTPATIHHARSGSGVHTPAAKAAFLAPFEQFYDALSDARVLKDWFGEQLTRVAKVAREVEMQRLEVEKSRGELEKQREELTRVGASGAHLAPEIEHLVRNAIHREVVGISEEMSWLKNRVHDLEEELRARDSPEAYGKRNLTVTRSVNGVPRPASHSRGGGASGNHASFASTSSGIDSYTFPPVQPPLNNLPLPPPPSATSHGGSSRRSDSPNTGRLNVPGDDHNSRERPPSRRTSSSSRSDASSPVPTYERGRRLSVSAMRYDPPPAHLRQNDNSIKGEVRSAPGNGAQRIEIESSRPTHTRRQNSHQGSSSAIEFQTKGHSKSASISKSNNSPPSRPASTSVVDGT